MVFGDESAYTEETRNNLKNVMLLEEQEDFDIPIYGKTGMGKLEGIVVDAWHTGFAEKAEGNIYFVYIWEEQMRRMFPVSLKKNHIELMDVRGISPFISSVFLCENSVLIF